MLNSSNKPPNVAIILCGGLGKRLRNAVSGIPKPMAPIKNKPFLHYLINFWKNKGINIFILSTGYLGSCIKDYFGNEFEGSLITYVQEELPLGTGGAIKKALKCMQYEADNLIVLNGDTWNDINIKSLINDFHKSNHAITMCIKKIDKNDRYGSLNLDKSNEVVSFCNKTGGPIINTGCYLLNTQVIANQLFSFNQKFSFESDVLPVLAAKRMVNASWQGHNFIDIGIPNDYYKFIDNLEQFIP
tara:strand:- start:12 stop:743 length:732 start_codon:yes stop_codon:yes gene_type:complete